MTMTLSDPRVDPRLATDVDEAESNQLVAYQDSLGFWTIGRGHKLPAPAPGRSWKGFTILPAVSDRYFLGDLIAAVTFAQKLPDWQYMNTRARQNALSELAFNMHSKIEKFTNTRAAWARGDWQGVHDGLLDSEWAAEVQPHDYVDDACARCGQVKENAGPHSYCQMLKNGRATRIANYFLNGTYPDE